MRGAPGLRSHLATFRRDNSTSDDEGNPTGVQTTVWVGRGMVKFGDFDSTEGSAGRPFNVQTIVFKCRPSAAILAGDYCSLVGEEWSVDAVRKTTTHTACLLISPPAQPFG